ncbi:MAG TPA: hypothetical protein VMF91_27685 [Bryobacteraceae bacterium]|nr:hypothetical protein [Bryobacteraceae bacterium]
MALCDRNRPRRTSSLLPDKAHSVLTVMFNCIDYEQTAYFQSHVQWAGKNGASHRLLTETTTGLRLDAHCAAWLRIPVMLALHERYHVVYLDNDCIVHESCPRVTEITNRFPGFFTAHGHSDRPNSGVMINYGSPEVLEFAAQRYAEEPPDGCRAPFENGHVQSHERFL